MTPSLRLPRGLPRLRAITEAWMGWIAAHPDGCVFLGASFEYDGRPGPMRDHVAAMMESWRAALERAVALAVEQGHLRPGTDPALIAFQLDALMQGLHNARLHQPQVAQDPGPPRGRRPVRALHRRRHRAGHPHLALSPEGVRHGRRRARHFAAKSTTVRSSSIPRLLRAAFTVGGWLMPATTVRGASRLFGTPLASSRSRALAADASDARVGHVHSEGHAVTTYAWGDPSSQPYVLFSHGWSSFGLRCRPWVAPLRAAGYAVVAFDHPGHGRNDGGRAILPSFAAALTAVARRHGAPAALVAHSMGVRRRCSRSVAACAPATWCWSHRPPTCAPPAGASAR